jgi:hypothetical protein
LQSLTVRRCPVCRLQHISLQLVCF